MFEILKPQQMLTTLACETQAVHIALPDVHLQVFIVVAQRITFQIQVLNRVSFQRIQLVTIYQLHTTKPLYSPVTNWTHISTSAARFQVKMS